MNHPPHADTRRADDGHDRSHQHEHEHEHGHGQSHGHGHAHGHGHGHAPGAFGRAFAIGITLNLGFVAVEAFYGFIAGSLALLADAGHNLSDVLGLAIAWGAVILSRRRPTPRFTYGLRSSSILAALFNAVFLLMAVGAIAVESIQRFGNPQPVAGATVMIVAAIGIVINGATALLFAGGRKGDLNIKGAYLHMAADAAVSAGVVAAGLAIGLTGWNWLDPLTSLVIVAVIVWGTWGLLRDAVHMSLAAVPDGIDHGAVLEHLKGLAGVTHVHDLHIWSMSTTEVALTAHLVRPGTGPDDQFLHAASASLRQRFGIGHATLQIECDPGICALEPDEVV